MQIALKLRSRIQKRFFFQNLFGSSSPTEPKFTESRVIPFSPNQIYDIVIDVNQYQEYLPWCSKSFVLESSRKTANADEKFSAELTVGMRGIFDVRILTHRL